MPSEFFIYALAKFYSRIVLKKINSDLISKYRNVERDFKKNVTIKADITYLKFCATNQLFPRCTDFRLSDPSAQDEPCTLNYKKNLIEREIMKKQKEQACLNVACSKGILKLSRNMSQLKFYACVFLLQRTSRQYESDKLAVHQRKLNQLYGSKAYLPQYKNNVYNISSYEPNMHEMAVLNRGLNFSVKKKNEPFMAKVEMEKLMYNIISKERASKVDISNVSDLKIKLKHFAIRNTNDESKQNLSPDGYRALKSLRDNDDIILQRPDKGGGVVIMNKADYECKLHALIADPNKFVHSNCRQSEIVKTKVNKIAAKYKISNPVIHKKLKIQGNFPPGHLYGLPKIHKCVSDPPLRPIISMSGTVTHELAQYLNEIIQPYIDQSYMLKSSDEFLLALQNLQLSPNQAIMSLDVESLFSNVPVDPTIDIILNRCYNQDSVQPPTIQKEDLQELLKICTQQTPFKFKNQLYLQSDGVSMGSPLGPTFANYYMSHLETTVLNQQKVSNPAKYFRYVDDCFVVFNSSNHVRFLIQRLKNRSVLNFTYETMQGNKFNFLDIEMSVQHDGKIETSVYIKPTDKGIYPNFHSHIPEQYKKSVINSLVNRAIKYCSSEPTLNAELDRIKQILSNNGYPQTTTERIIRSKLANINESQTPIETDNNDKSIRFYAQLFSLSKFKSDKKWLNQIVTAHVRGTEENSTVSVIAYYKPKKISSQFSTRSRDDGVDRVNVVYNFNPFFPTVQTCAVRETASLGIMGEPRVPPLNPSETIVLSEHYRL